MSETANEPDMLVRGVSLFALREYMRTKLEGGSLKAFLSPLSDDDKQAILNVEKAEWYPFDLQKKMRELIVRKYNPLDPEQAVFDACIYTAEYEMSTFLRAIMNFLPAKLVFKQTATVWNKYYSRGVMQTIAGDKKAVLELKDFPADKLFGPVVTAWLTVAARMLELNDVLIRQTGNIHKGDECWRWEAEWK
ncbi:hypothetical protein GX441_05360 [bacterium]|nr:hypothetical protein [bacterium]